MNYSFAYLVLSPEMKTKRSIPRAGWVLKCQTKPSRGVQGFDSLCNHHGLTKTNSMTSEKCLSKGFCTNNYPELICNTALHDWLHNWKRVNAASPVLFLYLWTLFSAKTKPICKQESPPCIVYLKETAPLFWDKHYPTFNNFISVGKKLCAVCELLIHQMLKLKVVNYCYVYLRLYTWVCLHPCTGTQRERERETEKETMSRTCKFLSVCEAAAVVEVV